METAQGRLASKVDRENGAIRVTHCLLNVIGKEGQDMFDKFNLIKEDQVDISKVLQEFKSRCVLVSNVIYKCYILKQRAQEAGETSMK